MNAQNAANFFGVTADAVKRQYTKNAKQLLEMASKAKTVKGKYRGKTVEEWSELARKYEALSNK